MDYAKPKPEHGWSERRNRFPTDQRLRRAGWRIASRAAGQEPRWERGGVVLSQEEALILLEREGE